MQSSLTHYDACDATGGSRQSWRDNVPTLSVEVERQCIKKIMQQVQQLALSAVTPEPTKQLVLDNNIKKALKWLEDVSVTLHCNNFN
jgi:hypothetical protein